MTTGASTTFQIPTLHFTSLFEALPGSCILLQNNAPHYTVLAATPEYLAQTGYKKEAIIGKGIFEMSPANPEDPTDTGASDLRDSLEHVRLNKQLHELPVQRYDIAEEGGSFSERYWRASNKPILSPDGEVAYIVHAAEDITAAIKAAKREEAHQDLQIAYHKIEEREAALKQFKFMADNAQDAFILMREDGTFAYLNSKALDAWGYTAEEAERLTVPDADPLYNDAAYRELFAKAQAQTIQEFETLHKRKDGDVFPVEVKVNGIILDGQPYLFAVARNITERKRIEQALRESEAKLKSVIEQTPAPTLVLRGDDFIIENINSPMLELIGRGLEVIGQPFLSTMPELQGQYAWEQVQKVYHEGIPFDMAEVLVPHKRTGVMKDYYYNVAYRPLKEDGHITGMIQVAIDVTEQVMARRKTEESEAKFRIMAESTPVLIAVADETGNAVYFNKAWTDVTGRPMQDLVADGWVDLVHPDDKERFLEIYQDAHAVKGPFTSEFRVGSTRGEYRWLLSHGVPRFHTDGSFAGHISACTDITEQKIGQQQLQTALEQIRLSKEAAELGTFDMDLERGTMHWDHRCRTFFGISHQGPVTYEKDFTEGLHPDDKDRILKVIDRLFIKSISNGDYDVEYRTVGAEDGVVRWVRAKGKVYFDAQEKPVRFIGSVLDITEKVTAIQRIEGLVEKRTQELAQTAERLLQANKELQRSNQNLEEFAHAASHDLKEPIRKIHFFTHQLREQLNDRLKEGELRSFGRIESATQRMGNLIDDLLLYSHVSQRPHQTEPVNLNEKIQRVLEDLDLDVEEKGATIKMEKLPVVKGYNRQLQQLFQNLVSNAIKYSKVDEPPVIEITAREAVKADQRYHLISVKDNGIGFAQEYANKIFQMFARLHGKAEYSGTGVGLSIVKKVVENHNGFIEVESVVNEGSVFKIYLPA